MQRPQDDDGSPTWERRATPRHKPKPVVETWILPPDPPEDPRPPVEPVEGRRRWPTVLLAVVALTGMLASLAVAVHQRDAADGWRDRAGALQSQRDEALRLVEQVQEEAERAANSLRTSEADVERLEARVLALADEKARAEDDATTLDVERTVYSDLAARVSAATDALDGCVTRLFDLHEGSVAAFNAAATGTPVDIDGLNREAEEATAFCNDARQAAADAGSGADLSLEP